MRYLAVFTLAVSSLFPSHTALAKDAQTAAPPAVQKEIQDFLAMIGRSQYQCAKPSKPRVISSEISQGAVIESGKLISGQVTEIWTARMCGAKAKYRFTIAPDASGELKLSGFESVE